MTRDEAVAMIQAFFKKLGVESRGLNEQNLGGLIDTDRPIEFEYEPASGSLKCTSVIYKFANPADPRILQAFKDEERQGKTDTGGGSVDYEPESQGLFLMRRYKKPVSPEQFAVELLRLSEASQLWAREVPARVAQKVFHPA